MADAETQYNLDKQYLEALTLDDVNAWVKQLLTPENQVITVEVPKKEGLTKPNFWPSAARSWHPTSRLTRTIPSASL